MAEYKVLVAGDTFMEPKVFSGIVEDIFRKNGLDVDVRSIEWPFKGYQKGRLKGVKREIREFAGNPERLAALVKDIDVLFVHVAPVTKEVLDAAASLKVVGCARGGPVNVDVDAATMKGIPVLYTPGRNNEAVADYTMGLILAMSRNIVKAHLKLKQGVWNEEFYEYRHCGDELSGKTLGLIGFGRVGAEVAKRARAFNMRIISYDPYVSIEVMASLGVEKVELENLLRESDIVSIHARLTPETRQLIGEKELRSMKPNAILINTARGEILDERTLLKALREGWISGAALDVFESEPLPPDHPFMELENVIITPHIAGASKQTVHRSAKMLAEDAARILRGEKPRFCINPEVFEKS